MKKEKNIKPQQDRDPKLDKEEFKPGDQFAYPPSEDIYSRLQEDPDMDVDDLTQRKAPNEPEDMLNEKTFKDDVSGGDLDVPGSELDDAAERNGSEDEENNSYSLGGDKKRN